MLISGGKLFWRIKHRHQDIGAVFKSHLQKSSLKFSISPSFLLQHSV
jgi:hypothetical protein